MIITYSSLNSVNPTVAGSYGINIGGTFDDTGTATVNILTNDQVSIAAEVAQSLTFTISDNTVGFGTLSASAARFATGDNLGGSSEVEAHNFVVGTNATAVGTEQFGLRLTATGGTGAVTAPYAASGFAFDSAAFPDQVAGAAGASANTTYSARYLANITANTEAGSYGSVVTYIATANY